VRLLAHSVISDPPFSRMDLVSCRNLLIYLGRELQDQVIPTFHYVLKPGGYLFLGTSEGIRNHSDLFSPLDKKQRIFQSRELGGSRIRLPMVLEERTARMRQFEDTGGSPAASAYRLRQRVDTQVLDRHVPPHVVVRKEGDIVYYSTRTGRFLEPPRGAPSRQLLDMVRREFRLDLRAALRQVMETGAPCRRVNVLVKDRGGVEQLVALQVEPLDGFGEGEPLYLVLFTMLGPAPAVPSAAQAGLSAADTEAELRDNHGIPFVFLSGRAREDLQPEFRDFPLLSKPVSAQRAAGDAGASGRQVLRQRQAGRAVIAATWTLGPRAAWS
jgi:two-component system, chemotaxis family, CheB/CheR fusion protein